MHREVLEEEARLRDALERIRLEEAAKSPVTSRWGWVFKAMLLIALLVANTRSEYQYIINTIVILYLIKGGDTRVHSRIDAILKLAELDKKKTQVNAICGDSGFETR